MKDDNVDDDAKDEHDNGIIGATATAAEAHTISHPFVWHISQASLFSILISFQYVDMRIEHGSGISYDLH